MITVMNFIDLFNLRGQLRVLKRKPDLLGLRDFLNRPETERYGIDTVVFDSFTPEGAGRVLRYHEFLQHNGFRVIAREARKMADGSLRSNLEGDMFIEAFKVLLKAKPEVFVLVSGNGIFSPLCQFLRETGMRVEVASLPSSLARNLKFSAHGFLDLTEWAESCEVLAA